MKFFWKITILATLTLFVGCSDADPATEPQDKPDPAPTPPISENEWAITDDIDTEFIDGQAIYFGYDETETSLDHIRLELWDAEPDSELGTIPGTLVKCKLYLDPLTTMFTEVPAATYRVVSSDYEAFTAEAGFDDGVNVPTGTYVSQRTNGELRYSMINAGTIVVSNDGLVTIDLTTIEGKSVKGVLKSPLALLDLSNREEQSDTPYSVPSTLTEDVNVDLSGVSEVYFCDYGDYHQNGTRNVIMQIIDEQKLIAIAIDLTLPAAELCSPLPEGTCRVDNGDHPAWSFDPGMMMMGNYVGSFYCNLVYTGEYYLVDDIFGPAADGSVHIKPEGDDIYTLTIDWIDNATSPHRIECTWRGKLIGYTYN